MKVDVYRNLHKDCWSVRSRMKESYGRVLFHEQKVFLDDVTFVVRPAGHTKYLETGVRNVHAFARGVISEIPSWLRESDFKAVWYSPREDVPGFYDTRGNRYETVRHAILEEFGFVSVYGKPTPTDIQH